MIKWISLLVIIVILVLHWPIKKTSPQEQEDRTKISTRPTVSLSSSERKLSLSAILTPSLEDQISEIWDEKTNLYREGIWHPSDPELVRLIRLFREYGRRDEVAAFALLENLNSGNLTNSHQLQLRMVIAGGWADRDPAAASRALLTSETVLPSNYLEFIGLSGGFLMAPPALIAVRRQASKIFREWILDDPEAAAAFGNSDREGWIPGIQVLFPGRLPGIELSGRSGNAVVNRNSIDAILNHPNRTSVSRPSYGYQIPWPNEFAGEPGFTYEEWAARNPDLAKAELKNPQENLLSKNLIFGLSRNQSDYVELLNLAPSESRLSITQGLISQLVNSNVRKDEFVWQLDGRESTWTLTQSARTEAVVSMIQNGGFSEEEQKTLRDAMTQTRESELMPRAPVTFRELPNRSFQPAED